MEKVVKTAMWIGDDAVRVDAFLSDFEGDVPQWKEAFYDLWRYQLTYGFAYEIKLEETGKRDGVRFVYLSILCRKAFQKNLVTTMEELGYRNIKVSEEPVGVIQIWDIKDRAAEDIRTVVAD